LAVLAITLVLALGAPFLLPYESNEVNIVVRLRPPALLGGTWEYPLGTDEVGRDVLTRLIYGARISLAVGFGAAAFAGTVGLVLGLLSGYFVGLLDEVIMRVADILLGFPFLLLAMLTVMMLGPGVGNMILVLGAFGWVGFARVVRAETLSVREKEFVEAARAVGCGDVRIIVFHILANVFHSMIILVTFSIATVMVVEAALSFLGLGVPPAIPSWGKMLSDSRNVMGTAPWMSILPGLCLTIVVLSLNLVGDWLRDYLDPRLRI
jgi:peptide/nickel transport system permease protein